MSIKIVVSESLTHGPGHAKISFSGLGSIEADRLSVVIKRVVADDPVLGPDGWQASVHTFSLEVIERTDQAVSVLMGPDQTANISANMGIFLDVTGPVTAHGQTGWPAITQPTARRSGRFRRRGVQDDTTTTVSAAPMQKPSQPMEPAPQAIEETPPGGDAPGGADIPPPEPTTVGAGGQKLDGFPKVAAIAAVVIVALLGGGYFAYSSGMFGGSDTAHPTLWAADEVRSHLMNKPDPAVSLDQGKQQLVDGKPDLAFLLIKQAASTGIAEAQRMLGEMYDPNLFSANTSPLPSPNGSVAADHYSQAVGQGDVIAMRNLGILMVEGQHGDAPDVENGKAMIRQAADEGDDKAAEYLEALQ